MTEQHERELVTAILKRNRYLVLSTTDGESPWIAPLEYMLDDDLSFYFFSTDSSRHVRHLENHETVAVAVFDSTQPDYSSDLSAPLNGVQMEATARKVPPADYNDAIVSAIEALKPPMPPYSVFKIRPERFYLPKIEKGVNVRVEVDVSGS